MNKQSNAIKAFNLLYRLPINGDPTLYPGEEACSRLKKFKATLLNEVAEVDEITQHLPDGDLLPMAPIPDIDALVAIADWLTDIQVYAASEMLKYGLPQEELMAIVMASNMSKQFPDGPRYDENGKVLKGPDYWKPEPKIKELLMSLVAGKTSELHGTHDSTQGEAG